MWGQTLGGGALALALLAICAALGCSSESSCSTLRNCGKSEPDAATGGTAGTASGGESGSDGVGGVSGTGGSQGGGNGGSGGENCDSSKSPSEESCLLETDEFGVFVSPLGDAEGDGTRQKPYLTLSAAILAAKAAGKAVFACASEGAFEEPLQIGESGDGTRLYGGFSCDNWTYNAETRTVVQSPTSTGLRVSDLVDGLLIEDFEIIASDATQPGESSMGAFVTNSENVAFTRVSLTAGDGADGEEGAGTMDPAEDGAPGNMGTAACFGTAPNLGGPQVETTCGGSPSGSVGGQGGNGQSEGLNPGNGASGVPDLGAGTEGTGESSDWSCVTKGNGVGGEDAVDQDPAPGAEGIGVLNAGGFISVAGGNGADGTPGQGGGGGGGAKAPTGASPCGSPVAVTGASGGSGGGGGCGGKGGQGGKGGGASFTLASVNSTITLSSASLTASSGGTGGLGGRGQPGGDGGERGGPGAGATTGDDGSKAGCPGGAGGAGGNGGRGGGGIGGPSVGIAYVGDEPSQSDVSIKVASVPAAGGLGGGGSETNAGQNGLVMKTQLFPSN